MLDKLAKKIAVSDNELTDIKRLKEIDAKLEKQKDILWNKFVLSKFKDETIREKLRKINGQIVEVQIPLIEHEIRERDSKTVKAKEPYHYTNSVGLLIEQYEYYISNLSKCIKNNPNDIDIEVWESNIRTYSRVIEDLKKLGECLKIDS